MGSVLEILLWMAGSVVILAFLVAIFSSRRQAKEDPMEATKRLEDDIRLQLEKGKGVRIFCGSYEAISEDRVREVAWKFRLLPCSRSRSGVLRFKSADEG